MSENTTNGTETSTQAAPAKKASGKKTAKKTTRKTHDRGVADVPARQRRLALIRALKKLGAISAASARPVSELASKLGYTPYDVYCLGYHKYHLAREGFVKSARHEDQRGLSLYLTAKGAKVTSEDDL